MPKARGEPLAEPLDLVAAQEALENEKAVPLIRLDLLGCGSHGSSPSPLCSCFGNPSSGRS